MQGSWWKQHSELDQEQQAIINLSPDGRYLILGPPGSGKTNLLLLRTQWLSLSGKKNVLFLTLGKSLAEFIKTGVGPRKIINDDQVKTYNHWAKQMMYDYAPELVKDLPNDYDGQRNYLANKLKNITDSLPNNYYDAIAIDEVQDLKASELEVLSRIANRLMVAGDYRQSIYAGDGIQSAVNAGFEKYELKFHYRIGREICKVADKVYPPDDGNPTLLQRCQYSEQRLPSSARLLECTDKKQQCNQMVENLRNQLKAYPDEAIGILLPSIKFGGILEYVISALDDSEFAEIVEQHNSTSRKYPVDKRIFILTCHSAKGTEFRAVHLMAAELMRGNLGRRSLIFTAVTRAKTSLTVYYSDTLPPALGNGFAEDNVPDIQSLF